MAIIENPGSDTRLFGYVFSMLGGVGVLATLALVPDYVMAYLILGGVSLIGIFMSIKGRRDQKLWNSRLLREKDAVLLGSFLMESSAKKKVGSSFLQAHGLTRLDELTYDQAVQLKNKAKKAESEELLMLQS
jgi:hypothetical protein